MKQFSLTIDARSSINSDKFIFHEFIEADNLVELYSKLLLVNAQMQQELNDEEDRYSIENQKLNDVDDIPF